MLLITTEERVWQRTYENPSIYYMHWVTEMSLSDFIIWHNTEIDDYCKRLAYFDKQAQYSIVNVATIDDVEVGAFDSPHFDVIHVGRNGKVR